jgi:hypothetical protein
MASEEIRVPSQSKCRKPSLQAVVFSLSLMVIDFHIQIHFFLKPKHPLSIFKQRRCFFIKKPRKINSNSPQYPTPPYHSTRFYLQKQHQPKQAYLPKPRL